MKTSNNGQRLFHAICLCITIGLIGKCIHNSLLDEDDTAIEYRKYNTAKDAIYPSLSFCIHHPAHLFYGVKVWGKFLDKNQSMVTWNDVKWIRQKYLEFLRGKLDNELMYKVDYDSVSTKLGQHLIELRVELQSNERIIYKIVNGSFEVVEAYKETEIEKNVFNRTMFTSSQVNEVGKLNLYISKRETHQKCFSFDTPFIRDKQIKKLTLHLRGMIFNGQGIKPDKKQFTLHYHYPQQTKKSFSTLDGWKSKADKTVKNYLRRFYLASVEVVRRRNKPSSPCIEGRYDEKILASAMKSVGCKHTVVESNDSFPICKTQKSFMEFEYMWKIKEHPPPCDSIQGLYEWHGEGDEKDIKVFCKKTGNCGKKGIPSSLIVQIVFTNEFYKEIVYTKKYTLETFIGNTGGYVGK